MLGQCWLPTLGLRKYARRIYVGPTSICQHRVRWRMVGCWLLSNVHTNHTWQQEAYQTLWYCQGHKALAWGGSRAHKPPVKLGRNRFFALLFWESNQPFLVLESSMHRKGLICLLLRTYILKQGISFRGSTLDPAGGSAPDICLHPTTCLPSPWAQPPQSKFYDYIALWQGAHKIDSSVQITQEAVRELETVGEETATHIREYSNGNL